MPGLKHLGSEIPYCDAGLFLHALKYTFFISTWAMINLTEHKPDDSFGLAWSCLLKLSVYN